MLKTRVSRRRALATAAAATALPLVHIRTAGAAGKLSVGFWDHWVPDGNAVMRKQVAAFAERTKVEVQADFITTIGNKNLLTLAAEEQARTGHDMQSFPTWEVLNHHDSLEPLDDVMGRLAGKYGPVNKVAEYLARLNGHWYAVPSSCGSQLKGPCGRISLLREAGFDPVEMFPAHEGAAPGAEAGPGSGTRRSPRPARRRASRLPSNSAPRPIRWTPPARCSPLSAPSWSAPRATSR